MKKNILCLIPARAGSRGVLHKNMREVGGFPLIAYSIIASKLSKYINKTIVSSDGSEIIAIAKKYGAEVPFKRPSKYAEDNSTDYGWILHALNWLKKHQNYIPNLIVHLRPTTPLRQISVIDEAISYFLQLPKATSLRSVHRFEESPYKMFVKDEGYLKPFMTGSQYNGEFYNLPRQHFPNVYYPNGYIDILRPSVIEKGTLHGSKIYAFETRRVTEVDCEEDLIRLNNIIISSNYKGTPIYHHLIKNL